MNKPQVAKRLEQCVGQDFDSRDCRVTNPHITARESIELADYIAALEAERDALAAQVEQLRLAALNAISFMSGGDAKAALRDAYDATPAQYLTERDAEVAADAYWKGYVAGGDDFRQGVSLGFVTEKASERVAKLYPNSEIAHKTKEQHQC